ncbi:hypothetical protein [Pseudactinotalea sp. Z1748]|uniref:hypothetical protein n=1 Tax=Pseudactinotalea sp. Z1748 TaxID=3413027 RepID=UPI003C7E3C22
MRTTAKTRYRSRVVGGMLVHYREAGLPSSTAVVLLHGAPSSSLLGSHAAEVADLLVRFTRDVFDRARVVA